MSPLIRLLLRLFLGGKRTQSKLYPWGWTETGTVAAVYLAFAKDIALALISVCVTLLSQHKCFKMTRAISLFCWTSYGTLPVKHPLNRRLSLKVFSCAHYTPSDTQRHLHGRVEPASSRVWSTGCLTSKPRISFRSNTSLRTWPVFGGMVYRLFVRLKQITW